MPDDNHDDYPLPEDVKAYLNIDPRVTVVQTDHGCMVKMKRSITLTTTGNTKYEHELEAEGYIGFVHNLDQFMAAVDILRASIARKIEAII